MKLGILKILSIELTKSYENDRMKTYTLEYIF